ncbi:MAG TPA: hypothetical protein VGR72_06120 [Candidatus Acidoferrales bacterium]|nr:hypothetical protein [Candidatus Acidoferrales bacterium]
MKVALDTDCFINAVTATAHANAAMKAILAAHASEKVTVTVSRHTLTELTDPSRRAFDLAKSFAVLPHWPIGTIAEQVATIEQLAGTWEDAHRNEEIQRELEQLAKSGNSIRDRGALLDALHAGADAFVTSDRHLVGSGPAKRIEAKFGIRILRPADLARELSPEELKMSSKGKHDPDDPYLPYVSNLKVRMGGTALRAALLYSVLAAAVSYIAVVTLGAAIGITALAGASVFAWLRHRSAVEASLENNYIETRGFYIARKIDEAESEVKREIVRHAEAVSDAVDSVHPEGVIDVAELCSKTDLESCPWSLRETLQQASTGQHQESGRWSFKHAEQFRTRVREELDAIERHRSWDEVPIYSDLTEKLQVAAKEVGMEDSWNHYNELERKLRQNFSGFLDKISHAKTGEEVAHLLLADKAFTRENLWNLRKYGLDDVEVGRYMNIAATALRRRQ